LNEAFDPTASQDEKVSQLRLISTSEIIADPNQPRKEFEDTALDDLAASIKEHGVIQPIIVVPFGEAKFMIVAGERRWRASLKVGLKKIPALVRTLSDQHKLEISLIENLQRENLNPLETATAYLKLRDQFNMKLEQISGRVGGKSIGVISNTIRLLRLPETAKKALVNKQISEGHARQILALDNAKAQEELLNRIIKDSWSVRRAEQFVIGYKRAPKTKKDSAAIISAQSVTPLTQRLAVRLKTDVKVKTTAKGGQLLISYKNEKDLDRITKFFVE